MFDAPKKPDKPDVKDKCPYCEKEYKNVDRHIKTCKKNPKYTSNITIRDIMPIKIDEEEFKRILLKYNGNHDDFIMLQKPFKKDDNNARFQRRFVYSTIKFINKYYKK